ncbi:MAG: glycosyltransferase family 2 protein [Verrucomicrobia bacterium]|nr:glycosyltransferase family 2 protein [Verrucomicrobiota bacterium]
MKLSIIIPVFNEKNTVLALLERVRAVPYEKELLVVDDASGDGTTDILKGLKLPELRTFFHGCNQGKGAAIRTAQPHVTGDIVIIQDADLEYSPDEYPKLLQPILDGEADAVYGSRFIGDRPHRVQFFWHMVGNKLLTLVSNMFTNLNLTDMETCYKVFRAPLFKRLRLTSNRFGFEPEVTARLAQHHARIYEVGIAYHGRDYAEGKKVNWKDGVAAFYYIVKSSLSGKRDKEAAPVTDPTGS